MKQSEEGGKEMDWVPQNQGRQFIFGVIALKFHDNLYEYRNSAGLTEHYTSPWLCTQTVTGYFRPITIISQSIFSYWRLYAAPLSIRRRSYELIGCWNKWRALYSKTGLCGWQCLQPTLSANLSRAENFPAKIVNLRCRLDLIETNNRQNKIRARGKTGTALDCARQRRE